MMKKFRSVSLVLVVITLLVTFSRPVGAQESEYGIRLRRDFGYGAGSNVRGTFSVSLGGDESQVAAVEFLIDGEVMAKVESAPFRFQFHTDDYGFGVHQLSARVFLHDGRVEITPTTGLNFVTPDDERSGMVTIFGGLFGAIVIGLLIFWLVQKLVLKRKPGSSHQPDGAKNYGLLGAAICPKCGRPFPRHIWGVNLLAGKLDRCEHCGKWSMTTRATLEELKAAEARDVQSLQGDKEHLPPKRDDKDALDDTRYMDGL
jgi:hypothetical protein